MAAALALLVSGCSVPNMYNGYVHAECDATTANDVTECRVTEKPLPTVTQTVTPSAAPTTQPPSSDGTQAATTQNWGAVVAGDEFNYTGAPDSAKWGMYDGPGHQGQGIRSPGAFNVANGHVTVTGNEQGTTGGMHAKFANQKYGRWEARMRTDDRDPKYHPVLILWPLQGWTNGTCWEIDYAEGLGSTQEINFFNHTGCPGQTTTKKTLDTTQWHNYAVEWTANGVIGYIDGVEWFRDMDPAHSANVSMYQTIQLDWFPESGQATKLSHMYVDWVRVYGLGGSTPGTVTPNAPISAGALQFQDEFNGTAVDTSKWRTNWYAEGGSMNGVGTYSRNASIVNGELRLKLESSTAGALVHTDFTGGYKFPVGSYVEARVFFPGSSDGSNAYNWPAWWVSSTVADGWPTSGEHDIAEVLGVNNLGKVTVNYHSPSGAHNKGEPAPGNWANGWHTFGIHRMAGSADVYYDGVKVKSYTTDDNGRPEILILNVGKSDSRGYFTGDINALRVDYVRAWQVN